MIFSFKLNDNTIRKIIKKYQYFINTIIKNYENVYASCKFFISTKFIYHFNDINFRLVKCVNFELLMLNSFYKCDNKKTRINFAKSVLIRSTKSRFSNSI